MRNGNTGNVMKKEIIVQPLIFHIFQSIKNKIVSSLGMNR